MITRRAMMVAAALIGLARPLRAQPAAATLYKNPECDCCENYAEYLKKHGFSVTVKATNDLAEISRKAGIPAELEGCHTMFIGDYVVEGHVPVEAIQKMLADRPAIKGITLPGMPEGSPGMYGKQQGPFTIYAIAKDGKSSAYMTL